MPSWWIETVIPSQIVEDETECDASTREKTAVTEPPPTTSCVGKVDAIDHDAERGDGGAARDDRVDKAGPCKEAGSAKAGDLGEGEADQEHLGLLLVFDGHALDAGFGIVPEIHVRVDEIVEDRPEEITEV